MKKIYALLLCAALTLTAFTGCAQKDASSAPLALPKSSAAEPSAPSDAAQKTVVRVGAMKGPTAMGMVKLMEDAGEKKTQNDYEFSIIGAVDEMTPKLVKGELDIAALPANLASVLYENTKGGVRVLAINTLGVLYLVETGDSVHSVADLKGKTIYASGKGATPEYALNYVLKQNGIDPQKDVVIEYKSEHAECVAALTASENGIAMLPQPFVATAQAKNGNIRIALDLTEEWEKSQGEGADKSSLITGVVVARTDFIQEHPEAVNAFLEEYQKSTQYVNDNADAASELIEKYGIVPAAVAKKALPYCNITFIDGDEMKTRLGGYLSVLFEQNPKAVGGKLPDEAFYYSR